MPFLKTRQRFARNTYAAALTVAVAFLGSSKLCSAAEEAANTGALLGIAKEKPVSGPFVEVEEGFMVPYTDRIPGTDITFEMIPVPGGEFLLGSPEDEEERNEDEGPQIRVRVEPMWVAKEEVRWLEYRQFMNLYSVFKQFQAKNLRIVSDETMVDAVTAPTPLYEPSFTYEYGEEDDQPAITMTRYAAMQYTKWLSRIAGRQYRLPTEAEWEYACRAGTKTAYSWGADADSIDDHAWYFDNCDEGPTAGSLKKANGFGLHDMHGRAAEWVVDRYTEDGYSELPQDRTLSVLEAVQWPDSAYPGVVRGGSWEMDPPQLRSAARFPSDDEEWKGEDPNFPRSPWWFTTDPSRGVGFRLFRSYKALDNDQITKFWDRMTDDVASDVQSRISGGRGVLGLVDEELPEAIKAIED